MLITFVGWFAGFSLGRSAELSPNSVPDVSLRLPASTRSNMLATLGPPLGKVILDPARRTFSFPASVNQRTGVVEYVVVTTQGKTHESVLRTDAEPQHIHLAALLLDAQPPSTPIFPSDLAAPLPGVPIRIAVLWTQGGHEIRRPLEDFVVTTNRGERLARGPWTYNGSYVSRGSFVAQQEGSIVSLQIDPSALINNPRPGRENDDLHHVNSTNLPPSDVPLRIEIQIESAGSTNAPAASAVPSHTP